MSESAFAKSDLVATLRCEPGAVIPCKLDWPMQKIAYWTSHPCDTRPAGQTEWCDPWGVRWRKESPDPGLMPFPIGHPLDETLGGLDRIDWPDPNDPQLFADLKNIRPGMCRLLVAEHPFALFERAWLMVGMQNLLSAMADRPEHVDALFARVGAFEEQIARRYIALDVEAAWIADDYGMNSALMFSPEMWRRFVRPHLRRVVDLYHDAGALVVLHSCGNVTPLVDQFLEVGIDALDPLQPECNQLGRVRQATAGRICLCGGIASTTLLAGDVARTVADTHRRIRQLGADGGYIVGPDDDQVWPDAARDAMLEAVEQYRDRAARDNS